MTEKNVLETCYSILRKATPLQYDCGKLCNGKCCKGDSKTGMLLFPGEEELIDENMEIIKGEAGERLAVCKGTCNRNKRPLACRIYPLFPVVVEKNGKTEISVLPDLRADCPIISGEFKFSRDFVKGVRRVGKYLLLNNETAEFLKELSEIQSDGYELMKKFM